MTILLVALSHDIARAILKFHPPKGKNEAKIKAANLCGFEPISPRELALILASEEVVGCFVFFPWNTMSF